MDAPAVGFEVRAEYLQRGREQRLVGEKIAEEEQRFATIPASCTGPLPGSAWAISSMRPRNETPRPTPPHK
ncbi:hypothetical protein HOK021_45960 [Streptomyces hygroscopicus]|nr:hypothetical protein HOK021_45960 [Streptomyces hygroscopicus]